MAGFFYKGILLQQHKEPALSRDLREFFNADTIAIQMARKPLAHPDEMTPLEIIDLARDAHIVDERDGLLLAGKLNACRGQQTRLVVGDAIDDEPYISSQINPLLKNQKLVALGLALAKRAAGAEDAHFAVYKNLTDLDVKIPKMIADFPVKRIRGRYPAEYQASKNYASGRSTLVIGVCALLHLARAAIFNKPQSTAFITVAGNCVGNPTNLEVSIGMTVSQVLERCGLVQNPSRVVIGGSMTGISVIDTEHTLIKPTTRAVLAFRAEEKDLNFNCIGCSRCVHVCPQGLNPFYLYRSAKTKRYHEFGMLDAQMCIGCGTCSYMCPAKLDLSETIRAGAEAFRPMAGAMRAASVVAAKQDAAEFELYMNGYQEDKSARIAARARLRKHAADALSSARERTAEQLEKLREAAAERAAAHAIAKTAEAKSEAIKADARAKAANAKRAAKTAEEAAAAAVRAEEEAAKALMLAAAIADSDEAVALPEEPDAVLLQEVEEVFGTVIEEAPAAETEEKDEDADHGWRHEPETTGGRTR